MEKYGIPVIQLNSVDTIDVQLKTLFKTKLKVKKWLSIPMDLIILEAVELDGKPKKGI